MSVPRVVAACNTQRSEDADDQTSKTHQQGERLDGKQQSDGAHERSSCRSNNENNNLVAAAHCCLVRQSITSQPSLQLQLVVWIRSANEIAGPYAGRETLHAT